MIREFYFSIDNECNKFYYHNNIFYFEEVNELYGDHLEANSRVMFHIKHADKNGNGNTIARGNDRNTAITHTCNANMLSNSNLSYDFGVNFNNSREFLDITKLPKGLN